MIFKFNNIKFFILITHDENKKKFKVVFIL